MSTKVILDNIFRFTSGPSKTVTQFQEKVEFYLTLLMVEGYSEVLIQD